MQVTDQPTRPSSVPLVADTHTSAVGLVTSARLIEPRRPSTTSRIASGMSNMRTHHNSYSSESHTAGRLRDKFGDPSRQNQAIRRQSSRPLSRSERDRDFIVDLAKFLRTRSPPPDNFMSQPETSETLGSGKTLPFKLFHRQKSKNYSPTTSRTFQLPDSAVAAKTIEGHWHLAISIPTEHDYLIGNPSHQGNLEPSSAKQRSTIREGPITVVKPLIRDVRPAALSPPSNKLSAHDEVQSPAGPRSTSFITSTIKDERLEVMLNGKIGELEPSQPPGREEASDEERPAGDSIYHNQSQSPSETLAAYNVSRQQSQRSDAQRSSETAFSVRSIESSVGHTRRKSSVSTAPSVNHAISPRGPESLKKQRSISEVSIARKSPSTGLPPASIHGGHSHRQDGFGTILSPGNPNHAGLIKESQSPDISQGEDTGIHKSPLKSVHGARRMLPDLPEGCSDGGISRKTSDATSAVITGLKSQRRLRTRQSMPFDRTTTAQDDEVDSDSLISLTPRSRREQVKALRSRDMAALRANTKFQQVMASVPMKHSRTTLMMDEAPNTRNGAVSSFPVAQEPGRSVMVNTMSTIMVVANLEPCSGSADLREAFVSTPPPSRRKRRTPQYPTVINGTLHSPKRSVSPYSLSSEDSDDYVARRRGRPTQVANSRGRKPGGQGRTYSRHHSQAQDGNIEVRMRRIEKTNAMMLRTLGAVVEMGVSFRELAELTASPEAQLRKAIGNHVERGLSTIEPLMLELNHVAANGEGGLVQAGGQ